MFDVKKSRKSNIVFPNIVAFSNNPKDNVAGIATTEIRINKITDAFILDILNLSIKVAQGPSTILIPDVIAADNKSTKNAQEIILPYWTWANILGSVTNTSPAPELGSKLKENTAGNIIIPARIANNVSDKIIV